MKIGEKFQFRVLTYLSDERIVEQSYKVGFTVSTRYAGSYKTVSAKYYRIGVLSDETAGWPEKTVIESVDATTYKMVEYFGPFDDNEWYFQIVDGVISYPDETPDGVAQTGNGQPFITCAK